MVKYAPDYCRYWMSAVLPADSLLTGTSSGSDLSCLNRRIFSALSVLICTLSVTLFPNSEASALPTNQTKVARPKVYANGGVLTYGGASNFGSTGLAAMRLSSPVTSMTPTTDGHGYWMAGADGAVYAFGDAGFFGSFDSQDISQYSPVVSIIGTFDSSGYWMATRAGGIFAFGDAPFYGSAGGLTLNHPIVAMLAAPYDVGYWLIASDGGVFAYGNVGFFGSAESLNLAGPIMGAAVTLTGKGYWLVGADGSVFCYGDAGFFGSASYLNSELADWNSPVVGIARSSDGRGYLLASANGGVYGFGDAKYFGSEGGIDPSIPVSAITEMPDGDGYWMLDPDGFSYAFSSNGMPSPFAQSSAIAAIADSQVMQDPNTDPFCNPYGPCEQWCSLFSTWVWQQAGIPIPSFAFTGDVYNWAAQNTSVIPAGVIPPVGDIVMYGTDPNPGDSPHTGTVVQTWPSGAIVTIEGDSGPDLDGHYSVVINGPFLPDDPWAYNDYPVYAFSQP